MTLDLSATRALGRSRVQVPALGIGTAPIGGLYKAVESDDAVATIADALTLPHPFVDTAPQYGHGLAEERVGAALAGVNRDTVLVASKVGRLLRHVEYTESIRYYFGTPDVNPVFDFSYDGVLRSFEESLARLNTDRVDILHIHDPDDHYDEALSGAYRALDQLRSEGVIGAVGAGMNQAEMLARFAQAADFDCFLLAGRYTLLDQAGLKELLPICEQRGIGVIVGGVYNSGILADPRAGAPFNYQPASDDLVERAQQLAGVCERHQVPLKAAAVQFPFGHPAVVAAVIGARTPQEWAENVAMSQTPIPAALWDELRHEGLLAEEVPTPA